MLGGFRAFMQGVVVPNAEPFAEVVRLVELSLGLAFFLDFLTNLAALGGVGQSLSIVLSGAGRASAASTGTPPSSSRSSTPGTSCVYLRRGGRGDRT